MTVDQQQTEITQIAPEPSSATPTLQETLNKMMSRITQMENTMLQIQANLLKLQCFQLPNISSNPAIPSAAEIISLQARELLPEHAGDLDNPENFDPASCEVVTVFNGDRDQSLVSSSNQSKKRSLIKDDLLSHNGQKRATVEDDSEDGNLQLHEEIIDIIIGDR